MERSPRSCPTCAAPIPETALFCPSCGAATPTEISRESPTIRLRTAAPDDDAEQRIRLQRALGSGFQLERLLGRGGFAEVYAALDLQLKREVAVKVVRSDLVVSSGLMQRFRLEAEAVAKLRHPNIVAIYQVGEAEGLAYYIMPLIQGESLRERLAKGALPIPEVRRILHEVCGALAMAHKAGIVHRDIKPDNIMLEGEEARAVVMDFGIAKALASGESGLTGTGMIIGTPHYMSPEQASGSGAIDARSDLYSLGVVAYQMLTARLPIEGDSLQEVLAAHLSGKVPRVERLRPDTPDDLRDVVDRCLARDPAQRWSSAADLAARLEGSVAHLPADVAVGRMRQWWRRRAPSLRTSLVVGAAALLLAAVAVLIRVRGGRGPSLTSLAVLPFDNVGSKDSAYFADGIADEVREKLLALPGLQVIARASSMPYRQTTRSPRDIGRELGVGWLLTGSVRWGRSPDGKALVHVAPELVSAQTGASRWQQAFEGPVTDVFRVQAQIAEQVASALGVELGATVQQRLAAQPTSNIAAYDAFLRGDAAIQGGTSTDERSLEQALPYYRQAIARDSMFARAWARIASVQSILYASWSPTPQGADEARRAAERAMALAPDEPLGHRAMAFYALNVAGDRDRALSEIRTAIALAPGDASVHALAAQIYYRLFNQWDSARVHYERAQQLNPRSAGIQVALGILYLYLRDYDRARQALDRAQAITPTFSTLAWRARVAVADGNVAEAQATIAAPVAGYGPSEKAVFMATHDLSWVLDSAEQLLLPQLPEQSYGDAGTRAEVLANVFYLRGDSARMRAYADTAERAFAAGLKESPQSAGAHAGHGLVLAYEGRSAEAIDEGLRAKALAPVAKDHYLGTECLHLLAKIYAVTGGQAEAVGVLDTLLSLPGEISRGWLRIDPNFGPLRNNPRFERLVSGH